MHSKDYATSVARSVPFDNADTDFDATNVQDAIEEIGVSASPGFSWGRSGNVTSNTFLLNDGVSSNTTGRIVFLDEAEIVKVFVSNQDVATYTIEIYSHDGDEINLTLIGTFSVSSARGDDFNTIIAVAKDKQLALRLGTGSARNVVAGLILKGKVSV